MFCCGFVGLALLLYFLFGAVVRTWHLQSPSDLWLNATLVSTCVMSATTAWRGCFRPSGSWWR